MKRIGIIILLCLTICGCGNKNKNYQELMKENEYVIIDVRTEEEYMIEHIKDAINIPYDEIEEKINISKDKMIFVYCRSGARSKTAYDTLTRLGYRAYDLGGIASINLPKES